MHDNFKKTNGQQNILRTTNIALGNYNNIEAENE